MFNVILRYVATSLHRYFVLSSLSFARREVHPDECREPRVINGYSLFSPLRKFPSFDGTGPFFRRGRLPTRWRVRRWAIMLIVNVQCLMFDVFLRYVVTSLHRYIFLLLIVKLLNCQIVKLLNPYRFYAKVFQISIHICLP